MHPTGCQPLRRDHGRRRVPLQRRNLLREPQGNQGTREAKVPLHQPLDQLAIELLVKECRIDMGVPALDGGKNIDTRRDLKFRDCAFALDPEEDQRSPM
ncbi:hypothetical protein MTO96_013184 [Rhipicephalus appendiculatus]